MRLPTPEEMIAHAQAIGDAIPIPGEVAPLLRIMATQIAQMFMDSPPGEAVDVIAKRLEAAYRAGVLAGKRDGGAIK